MLTRQCMLLVLIEPVHAERWAYEHQGAATIPRRKQHEGLLTSEPPAWSIAPPCLGRDNTDDINVDFARIQRQHHILNRGTADRDPH